jgi:hypothetical protein
MQRSLLLLALGAACAASASAEDTTKLAKPDEVQTATYAIDTEIKLTTDQRNRGISDSLNKPGVQLSLQLAHESGVIGLVQLSSVSKKSYTDADGVNLLLGAGYRFGDPDAWHFGVGLATEFFPGAKFSAPHGIDLEAGVPTDFRTTRYDTSYAVLEIGWGALEGRALNVISRTYRGADTGGVCGQILAVSEDPTKAIECYARGDHDSRGSWLFDLGYKLPLGAATTLNLHAGLQKIRHFKEADFSDYAIGITHTRWGFQWTAEWLTTRTKAREIFLVQDGDRLRAQDNNRLVLSVARKF